MKKVITLILALSLVFALSVTAFAADGSNTHDGRTDPPTFPGSGDDIYIGATYTHLPDQAPTVYYVTVEWTQTGSITYENGYTVYKWNPDGANQMTYTVDRAVAPKWTIGEGTKVEVTVTNKSNAAVNVVCSDITPIAPVTEIENTPANQSFTLASPAPVPGSTTEPVTATTGTATYTITDVTGSITGSTNIGKLTVSLSAGA